MHKAIPPLLALAVLSLGAVAGMSVEWRAGPDGPAAASPQRGTAGQVAEHAAVAAVRARLRGQSASSFTAIATHVLDETGTYVVCGRLGGPGGPDVVARVIPTAGVPAAPEGRASHSMVVMEDAPGLWRGGARGLPWQRYCGAVERPAQDVASAPPTSAGIQPAPETVAEGAEANGDGGSVTVASPVRVRSEPNGQSDILWVAERGRAFTVYGHAPGGWVQVGDGMSPAGWVHSSLLATSL